MLVVRFFAGVGGSTFSTMVGGIVADMYPSKTRNVPMSLFAGFSLLGIGLGPMISGFIAQYTSWRWIFYFQAIVAAVLLLAVIFFFPETRGNVILKRKAFLLNRWQEKVENAKLPPSAGRFGSGAEEGEIGVPPEEENDMDGEKPKSKPNSKLNSKPKYAKSIRWKALNEDGSDEVSLKELLIVSLIRPFHFLVSEPVVFFFSLWMAFSWAVLYIAISAIPMVFETQYNFSLSQSNAVLAAMCIGSILAVILSIFQDFLAEKRPGWNTVPEHRLYFSCIESFLLPIGLFVLGWTAEERIHWIVPTIFIAIMTMGIFSIYLAVFNYFADTYQTFASSTIAAQSFCRNMLGGAFPLVSRQLFHNLGYGPASTLLGGIATLLTLVPWVLVFFGPTIRGKSKIAGGSSRQKKEQESNC